MFEPVARAERTRSAILSAAEEQFARRGYAATRLEDVATTVGVTRAALFYYFKDKQALYDATTEDAFGSLAARLDDVFATQASVSERIERAVEAWVDAIVERPTLARLVLRYVADSAEGPTGNVYPASQRLMQIGWSLFEEGRASGELDPLDDDPFQSASAVVGATVFYVAALSALVPSGNFDPLSPEHVEAHKRYALHATRHLLGIRPTKTSGSNGAA